MRWDLYFLRALTKLYSKLAKLKRPLCAIPPFEVYLGLNFVASAITFVSNKLHAWVGGGGSFP
jgi:hypothetical protein